MSIGRGRMPGPQDNNRRELRRPMGGDDELARGMGRMDPFGYNQYGGSGGRYGMPNQFEPPRPAPNADGWSSGEDFVGWNDQGHQFQHQPPQHHHQQHHNNHHRTPAQSRLQYNQQQYQQRQQQQQWGQPPIQQWNIGASEFVPKSNLSVSAEEFVPRTMARNTSQWAYQQQQQQQQQQMSDFSANSYGYQPHMNYPGSNYGNSNDSNTQYESSSSGMPNYGRDGGGGGSATASHYDPSEVLSDAIATIVFMPSKFDRTTYHLAEKFNKTIGDRQSLSDLVTALVEQCLQEDQFLNLAGRMCAYLAKNVSLNFDGVTLKSLLVQKFEDLVSQSSVLLQGNEKRVHCLVTIVSDVYLQLTSADGDQSWKKHDVEVGDCLYKLLTVLFQTGTTSNVKIATQKLKLCGKTVEGEEKYINVEDLSTAEEEKVWAENPAPKMDALITLIEPLASKDTLPEDMRKDVKTILETRKNNRWADAEAENAKAKEAQAQAMQNSAPKKSSAIRIEPDPNDDKTKIKVEKPPANDGELTEEELKFMSEEIGEEEDSELEEPDGMTEDIADAYEQFLAEQSQKNGGS